MQSSTRGSGQGLREQLRIVWAITAKDLVDAVKNRTTLSVILTTLFLIVAYRCLPALMREDERTNVLVYDAGASSLVAALEGSLLLDVYNYPSRELMERDLVNGYVPELGLIVPPGFDRTLQAGGQLELQGYVLQWVNRTDADALRTLVEGEISDLAGHPVSINLEGNRVYTRADSAGYPFLTSFALIYVTTIIGLTLVPYLMIEEKQSKTMDALLISPASSSHIVLGKALAGLVYTLISVAIALTLNYTLVANWVLVLLVAICGSVFGVALGLLLGSLLEVRQQMMLWGWALIVPLLMPVFLSVLAELLPEVVRPIIEWVPTVALSRAFRASFSDTAPLAQVGPELALVAGCGMLVLVVVAWVVRRSDR